MMMTIMMDDRSTQLMGVLNVYLAAAWHVESILWMYLILENGLEKLYYTDRKIGVTFIIYQMLTKKVSGIIST